MTGQRARPPKGAVIWGVVKWLPFLALPFSVFFLEVRWQHEIFANDYETNKLSNDLRDMERRIAEYEDQEARLKTMELMETMALELKLVEPAFGQVETLCVPSALCEPGEPAVAAQPAEAGGGPPEASPSAVSQPDQEEPSAP